MSEAPVPGRNGFKMLPRESQNVKTRKVFSVPALAVEIVCQADPVCDHHHYQAPCLSPELAELVTFRIKLPLVPVTDFGGCCPSKTAFTS